MVTSHGARIFQDGRLIADIHTGKVPDLDELREKLRGLDGVLLEEKEGCFALHFRNFKGDEERVKEAFYSFIKKYPRRRLLRVRRFLRPSTGNLTRERPSRTSLRSIRPQKG